MENENKMKVRVKHNDRVSISPKALSRIEEWMETLQKSARGIKLTKNDLVDFIILNHSEKLSEGEVQQLKDKYFDEVRFAEWATKQLKAAKAQGRYLTLSQIMGGAQCPEQKVELAKIEPKEKEKKTT